MLLRLLAHEMLFTPLSQSFIQCHAPTLVRLATGDMLVAYFAGSHEGSSDSAIWLSRRKQGRWLAPQRVTTVPDQAHWNPVLHYQQGKLWLFYKAGVGVHQWQSWLTTSDDDGYSWRTPQPLVAADPRPRGPVKNKLLVATNGVWLAPASTEDKHHWDVAVDRSGDHGGSWQWTEVPLRHWPAGVQNADSWQGLEHGILWENDIDTVFRWDGLIQPALWESAPGQIHMLTRSTRGQLWRSDSGDYGLNWSAAYATSFANNNSGIDVVRIKSGVLVLACNPVAGNWGKRTPLSLYLSQDNGGHWQFALHIEQQNGEFSYPALIADDQRLHLTYSRNRSSINYCLLGF